MNTGVGDVTDLAWKLWAVLAGWGRPTVARFVRGRAPAHGLRNVKASRGDARRLGWRAAYNPHSGEHTRRCSNARRNGKALRHRTAQSNRNPGNRGRLPLRNSPIVWPEAGDGPDPDSPQYIPTTWPGARCPMLARQPHRAARPTGPGFTLLRLGKTSVDTENMERAFQEIHAPIETISVESERAREIYGCDLLVRPICTYPGAATNFRKTRTRSPPWPRGMHRPKAFHPLLRKVNNSDD